MSVSVCLVGSCCLRDGYTARVTEHVGRALRRIREEKGITSSEVQKASGLSKDTLSRIELGKRSPHPSTLKSIVGALKLKRSDTTHPRLLKVLDEADIGGARIGVGIEDRLAELLDYIKTLKGQNRSNFIRASIALLTALEYTGPSEGTGTTENDERR